LAFEDFAERLADTRRRIVEAASRSGRNPGEVTLVAVTKGHAYAAMTTALEHGVIDLGENRVQEAVPKLDQLGTRPARVHLIGQLQTNKVNKVVGRFASIMSVDRAELLERIIRRAGDIGQVQPVFIQANTSGEGQKAGCSPDEARTLVEVASASPEIDLLGLMTMGRAGAGEAELRAGFAHLRGLRDELIPGGALSMGMSGDFEVAIEEGATHVRLGTTLFGPRPPRP
jgi:pyridoxal phosphate enzyme (YggS family)